MISLFISILASHKSRPSRWKVFKIIYRKMWRLRNRPPKVTLRPIQAMFWTCRWIRMSRLTACAIKSRTARWLGVTTTIARSVSWIILWTASVQKFLRKDSILDTRSFIHLTSLKAFKTFTIFFLTKFFFLLPRTIIQPEVNSPNILQNIFTHSVSP